MVVILPTGLSHLTLSRKRTFSRIITYLVPNYTYQTMLSICLIPGFLSKINTILLGVCFVLLLISACGLEFPFPSVFRCLCSQNVVHLSFCLCSFVFFFQPFFRLYSIRIQDHRLTNNCPFVMQFDVWARYMRDADKKASRYSFLPGAELSNKKGTTMSN